MTIRKLVLIWLAIFAAVDAFAEEPELSKEEIQQLIADLVSPNTAPGREGPRAVYPAGFDRGAQARVSSSFRKLYDLGPKVFPYLFDHFDDKRYSLTGDGMEAAVNKSVGDLCLDIVKCHLQPYGSFARTGSKNSLRRLHVPSYFQHVDIRNPDSAREWWNRRQDKSLQELQIEVLEWIIAEEEKAPEKYKAVERDYKRKMLEDLRKADVPLKPSWPFAR